MRRSGLQRPREEVSRRRFNLQKEVRVAVRTQRLRLPPRYAERSTSNSFPNESVKAASVR